MRWPTSWSYYMYIPSFGSIGRKLYELSGNEKFTDGGTDAEGYNIIRPFFKRAYKNCIENNHFSEYLDFSHFWHYLTFK